MKIGKNQDTFTVQLGDEVYKCVTFYTVNSKQEKEVGLSWFGGINYFDVDRVVSNEDMETIHDKLITEIEKEYQNEQLHKV